MSDEKQDSVLDMTESKETTKTETNTENKSTKKSSIQVNVSLSSLTVVLAIAAMGLAFLASILTLLFGSAVVYTVFKCLSFVALVATFVFYLMDYLKHKEFSVNPAFICMILAVVVFCFQ